MAAETPTDFFPDGQHVEEVRRALWAGRAAVMVGAGMSCNAVPGRPGLAPMPSWVDLIGAIIDRLHPAGRATESRRADLRTQATATSAALRLAEEFAVAFGRPALDDLILQLAPEGDYSPGALHRSLVGLPWADILTTNYDTLLERAAADSLGQRYSVVRTPEEVPAAARPRIVKLHGSFPSTRPFVLTEEDFRTYPRKFAPFVNLAQQAVMENAVCLVGFSGDDPNFLYWTGWVRDNLSSYAQNVYLCGVLELSGSQRLLLSARRVTPVDFAPLFPRDRYPDPAARHGAALDWFLNCLKAGRPSSPIEWPDSPHDRSGSLGHLPELLPSREVTPLEERWHPTPSVDPAATASEQALVELRAEVKAWKYNRAIYPGWLVAPSEVRKRLWFTTEAWQGQFLEVRPSLGVAEQLDIVSELNWRLETALLPVWSDLLPAYQHALGAVNPRKA